MSNVTSFDICRGIESESLKTVETELFKLFDAVFDTNNFNNFLMYQQYYGDYLAVKNADKFFIEVKSEQSNKWGNFYLETWSNKPENVGWFKKCRADLILYHFIADKMIYIFDLQKAQQFVESSGDKYPEKPQSKYSQRNKSFGLCVPVNDIMDAAGVAVIKTNEDK